MTESAPKRIVVFAAHGDDLEFTCGGTIAKLTDRGHQVALVVATVTRSRGVARITSQVGVEVGRLDAADIIGESFVAANSDETV